MTNKGDFGERVVVAIGPLARIADAVVGATVAAEVGYVFLGLGVGFSGASEV